MAQSNDNDVVLGLSGRFGKMFVFRQHAGKTIVSRRAGPREKELSEAQLAAMERFQQAVLYGKAVMADPAAKEQYDAAAVPGVSAYNVALADFLKAPKIRKIDVSNYFGQVGQPIMIQVTDDFKVKAVTVVIENEDGSLVEEGAAVQQGDSAEWLYTATVNNENLTMDKITVTATDNPANVTKNGMILQ